MNDLNSMAPIIAAAAGVLALLFAVVLAKRVTTVAPGNEKMTEIMGSIHEGAMAFLSRQYKTLIIFVAAMAVVIVVAGMVTGGTEGGLNPMTVVPFVAGAYKLGVTCIIGLGLAQW